MSGTAARAPSGRAHEIEEVDAASRKGGRGKQGAEQSPAKVKGTAKSRASGNQRRNSRQEARDGHGERVPPLERQKARGQEEGQHEEGCAHERGRRRVGQEGARSG